MLELFTKKPIFQGNDEIHQLDVIYKILGTPIPLFRQPGALFLAAGGLVYLVVGAIEGYAERVFVLPHGTLDGDLGQRAQLRPVEQGLAEVRKDGSMARYSEVDVWELWEFEENEMQRDRVGELAVRAASSRPTESSSELDLRHA